MVPRKRQQGVCLFPDAVLVFSRPSKANGAATCAAGFGLTLARRRRMGTARGVVVAAGVVR